MPKVPILITKTSLFEFTPVAVLCSSLLCLFLPFLLFINLNTAYKIIIKTLESHHFCFLFKHFSTFFLCESKKCNNLIILYLFLAFFPLFSLPRSLYLCLSLYSLISVLEEWSPAREVENIRSKYAAKCIKLVLWRKEILNPCKL